MTTEVKFQAYKQNSPEDFEKFFRQVSSCSKDTIFEPFDVTKLCHECRQVFHETHSLPTGTFEINNGIDHADLNSIMRFGEMFLYDDLFIRRSNKGVNEAEWVLEDDENGSWGVKDNAEQIDGLVSYLEDIVGNLKRMSQSMKNYSEQEKTNV